MTEKQDSPTNWYRTLLQRINEIAEELGLDDFGTGRMRDFVVDVARQQYQSGNKSGIRWAYSKQGTTT